jgi:hypothetical protein
VFHTGSPPLDYLPTSRWNTSQAGGCPAEEVQEEVREDAKVKERRYDGSFRYEIRDFKSRSGLFAEPWMKILCVHAHFDDFEFVARNGSIPQIDN